MLGVLYIYMQKFKIQNIFIYHRQVITWTLFCLIINQNIKHSQAIQKINSLNWIFFKIKYNLGIHQSSPWKIIKACLLLFFIQDKTILLLYVKVMLFFFKIILKESENGQKNILQSVFKRINNKKVELEFPLFQA